MGLTIPCVHWWTWALFIVILRTKPEDDRHNLLGGQKDIHNSIYTFVNIYPLITEQDTHLCVNSWVDHEKFSSELLGKYESLLTAYMESAESSILFCQDVRTLYISLKSFFSQVRLLEVTLKIIAITVRRHDHVRHHHFWNVIGTFLCWKTTDHTWYTIIYYS